MLLKIPGNISRGDYESTIDTYLTQCEASQILVGFYDAIRNNPISLMSDITSFLKIKPFDETEINNKVPVNPSPEHDIPEEVREYLTELFSHNIEKLADKYGSYASLWLRTNNRIGTRSMSEQVNVNYTSSFNP